MKLLLQIILFFAFVLLLVWIAVTRPILLTHGDAITAAPPSSYTDIMNALRKHIEFLSIDCVPRSYENLDNLNKAAKYIESELSRSAAEIKIQKFTVDDTEFKNIIGIFGPETEDVFVVGAHYDAFGDFPGADDNASGVAGLIELGHILSEGNLNIRVLLIAYTLEEPPFFRTEYMGSAVHAQSLIENNIKVRLMISLEMIGYFTDEKNSQSYPNPLLRLFYPNQGNFIAVVDQFLANNAYALKRAIDYPGLSAFSINAPAFIPGVDFSDHMNYWNHGFSAVMVTDTAFYRNTAYHTANDTHDRLNYLKIAQVVYGISRYLHYVNE